MPTFIIFVILFVIAALSSGCQSAASSASTPDAVPPVNTAKKDDPKPAEPKAAEPTSDVGSLATPTEAYKTAFELRKNKDVQGLKKIMSDDIKEFLTMMGEEEKKSLDDMIKDMCEKPQAERAEVRNEKIKGDWATVEYLTEKGEWKTMDFEKVGGKWLMTFPKGDSGLDKEPNK